MIVVAELADVMLGVEFDAQFGDQIKLSLEEVDMMFLVVHQLPPLRAAVVIEHRLDPLLPLAPLIGRTVQVGAQVDF